MTQGILPFCGADFSGRSFFPLAPGLDGERYQYRDLSWSAWHRPLSVGRFLSRAASVQLTMLDFDSMLFSEYDCTHRLPLALVEVAIDVGQEKLADITAKLAELAGIPAYVALYTTSAHANPANPQWPDINQFRVKRLWPSPEEGWRVLTPQQWADALLQIRGWQLKRFEVKEAANDERFDRA